MKHLHQLFLCFLALSATSTLHAANPCTTGGAPFMRDGSGAGGTGLRAEAGDGTGQGGTGISIGKKSEKDGSGSGGTGLTVQVDGAITGFGSICVNGLELHYVPTTPVTLFGRAASAKDLKIGHIVRALAHGQGDQLTLQRIGVRHLLVSPVQGLEPGKLRTQDRNISLSPNVVLPSGLAPGVKVAVSGFVGAQGYAVATRLDVVPNDTPDSLTGEVHRNAQGQLAVDGIPLDGRLPKLEPGETVRAEGSYANGRLQVTRFEREERVTPVDRIVIQGFIRHVAPSAVNVNDQRFLIDSRTLIKEARPRVGEWAKIDAIREGNQFHARDVEISGRPGNIINTPVQEKHGTSPGGRGETISHHPKQEHSTDTDSAHTDRDRAPMGKAEAPEKVEAPERIERTEKIEVPEKIEAPERIERPEKVEAPEKIEAPERIERPEKIEAPERIERPEKIEAPERIERPEKIEAPERIERPEIH